MSRGHPEPLPLSVGRGSDGTRTTDAPPRGKRGWEGLMHAPSTSGVYMTPCVRAIQASTGLVHRVTVTLHLLSRCERCSRLFGYTSSQLHP